MERHPDDEDMNLEEQVSVLCEVKKPLFKVLFSNTDKNAKEEKEKFQYLEKEPLYLLGDETPDRE